MESLILDLLEWLNAAPRTYREAMDTWRTSCPHVAVWEEALLRGYVRHVGTGSAATVAPTEAGLKFLAEHRPQSVPAPLRKAG
jgi:hypothetical protein